MFAIVRFLDESDAPGIVCSSWISKDGNVCRYPDVKTNEARDRLLRRLAEPDKNWSSCRIKILHKYSNFSIAHQHLRQAEETSNLESDEECVLNKTRKRQRAFHKYPGEESDDDCTPTPSQKSRKYTNVIPYPVPPTLEESDDDCTPTPSQKSRKDSDGISYPVPPTLQYGSPSPSAASIPACSSSQTTIMNGKLIAWMADISAKFKQLEGKVDLLLERQSTLLLQHNQVPEKDESNENFEVLGSLPVTDDESFQELNRKILEAKQLRNLLIKVLISVGGKDMRSYVTNMLRRVLSDEVAETYNLSGKSTLKTAIRKPFLATEVSKAIFSACQKVFKDTATDLKIREAIGDWLNQAKVRKMRRLQRQETTE